MLSTKQKAHAALVTANVIFGAGNIVSKVGLKGTNPVVFALVREVVSGPLLLIISLVQERRRHEMSATDDPVLAPTKSLLARLHALRWRLLLCGAALFGTNLCYIVGVKLSGPTTGAVWQSAQPTERSPAPIPHAAQHTHSPHPTTQPSRCSRSTLFSHTICASTLLICL